jgi:hypothetical protein
MKLKTLADIKRAMTIGTKWQCNHYGFTIRGNLGQTDIPAKDMGIREIGIVQKNGVAFKTDTDTGSGFSWFYYPSAKEVVVKNDGFDVLNANDPSGQSVLMSYTAIT